VKSRKEAAGCRKRTRRAGAHTPIRWRVNWIGRGEAEIGCVAPETFEDKRGCGNVNFDAGVEEKAEVEVKVKVEVEEEEEERRKPSEDGKSDSTHDGRS
jgi:hypothetical protein